MSKIESDAAAKLRPMVVNRTADSHVIAPADHLRIARWAYQIALMLDLAQDDNRVIPSSEYPAFYQSRRPPRGSVMWLSAYGGVKWAAWARRHELHLPVGSDHLGVGQSAAPNLYVITFNAFRILFQIVHFFGNTGLEVPDTAQPWRHALGQIWPLSGTPFVWPINASAFDDEGLDDFSLRMEFPAPRPVRRLGWSLP